MFKKFFNIALPFAFKTNNKNVLMSFLMVKGGGGQKRSEVGYVRTILSNFYNLEMNGFFDPYLSYLGLTEKNYGHFRRTPTNLDGQPSLRVSIEREVFPAVQAVINK